MAGNGSIEGRKPSLMSSRVRIHNFRVDLADERSIAPPSHWVNERSSALVIREELRGEWRNAEARKRCLLPSAQFVFNKRESTEGIDSSGREKKKQTRKEMIIFFRIQINFCLI